MKDITRTYPTNKLFRLKEGKGQKALFNVLKVYSILDPEVGYCQGMSFLCGMLVCHMSNEEDIFWCLSSIMKSMGLRGLFLDHLPLLKQYVFCFSQLIPKYMPNLAFHLERISVNALFYSSEWFSTVFSYNTRMDVAARIWDVFLLEGPVFIFKVALAILKKSEDDLMKMTFEPALIYLKAKPSLMNESIIEEADKFNGVEQILTQLQEAYLQNVGWDSGNSNRHVQDACGDGGGSVGGSCTESVGWSSLGGVGVGRDDHFHHQLRAGFQYLDSPPVRTSSSFYDNDSEESSGRTSKRGSFQVGLS
eukprot:TRINITY_DN5759_c0_g1_i13.p1 TRINITY_DN5759_c0_g1~~TRINITY_DN5759_c0_g1_i13.p1  ORF type:complete len:306 (+),score=64.48 TRINITY_DN5759_c0_g1_i13:426-1343(+)